MLGAAMTTEWQSLEKRSLAVEELVTNTLDRTVSVTPSDHISGGGAFGGAKSGRRGTLGIGSTPATVKEALAWRGHVGADHYTLIVPNASNMTAGGWKVLMAAMPIAGLVIIADKLKDVPFEIRDASVIVNGLCPDVAPDVRSIAPISR